MARLLLLTLMAFSATSLAPTFVPTASASDRPGRLSVVFDEENLPYSSRRERPPGLNVDLARLIASRLELTLDIHWVNTEREGLLSFLVDDDEGVSVQAAVGVPLEAMAVEDERLVGPEVLFSEPFASTRYVLVMPKAHAPLREFRAIGLAPVGVERAAVASMRLWDSGFVVTGMQSQRSILEAIVRGDIDYGVLWSNAGWLIHRNERFREALTLSGVEPKVSGLEWDLGVAVNREHAYLLPRLNEAIAALRSAGAFEPVFRSYHVPFFPARRGNNGVDLEESSKP